MPIKKSSEAVAKAKLVNYVYRWWLYGKGTLLDTDCNAKNIGLARGAEQACAELQQARRATRERRKGE